MLIIIIDHPILSRANAPDVHVYDGIMTVLGKEDWGRLGLRERHERSI